MKTATETNNGAAGKPHGWHGGEVLAQAERYLAQGGSQARREIVKTTLELQRLLQGESGR